MKTIKIGEVVIFEGNLYLIYCRFVDEEGIARLIKLAPFVGDPESVDDKNAALIALNS